MRAVIQRVTHAEVKVDNNIEGAIGKGLMVLLGVKPEDTQEQADWLVKKILNMRIMDDAKGVMNESVMDQTLELLIISQFTLYASTKKGNRPSYIKAARPEIAIPLYEYFIAELSKSGLKVESGVFGADMKVTLLNDGPVTIIIDSDMKE